MIKLKKNNSGFTLIEMIAYVAIFSVILFVIVRLFWQVQIAGNRETIRREVRENGAQAMETIQHYFRKAQYMNSGSSVFDVHPGVLSLKDGGINVIDTYTKNIVVGGGTTSVRKLRLTEVGTPYDLTSDHVDVTNFVIRRLTQGADPDVIEVSLGLSNVNPGYDPEYDYSLNLKTSIVVREGL